MTVTAPKKQTTIDNIFLQLVHTADEPMPTGVTNREVVQYILKGLECADKELATEFESILVQLGQDAIPFVVQGLASGNNTVRSVCAMVLIRIGAPSVRAVKSFYHRNAFHQDVAWVVDFILEEFGESVDRTPHSASVAALEALLV